MATTRMCLSGVLAAAALSLSAAQASAVPFAGIQSVAAVPSYAATDDATVQQVRWRGGGWRGGRGIGLGIGAGILGGALLGSALSAPYYDRSYGYYPSYSYYPRTRYYYSRPAYGGYGNSSAYCSQRFRSYDPASGTYLGYDGYRHPCP